MMILEPSTTRSTKEEIDEQRRRRRLFTLAHGENLVMARLALKVLWNVYRVRLPLVEKTLAEEKA